MCMQMYITTVRVCLVLPVSPSVVVGVVIESLLSTPLAPQLNGSSLFDGASCVRRNVLTLLLLFDERTDVGRVCMCG